jgi:sialate O-acetylesterase
MFSVFLLLGLFGHAVGQCGDFQFASYYGDHMVLQRAPSEAVVWGYATEAGDEVVVEMDDQVISTNAFEGPFGNVIWQLHLEPMEEGGPHTITATSRDCSITLDDVLFGDVWICSGQSNMAHRLENIDDPDQDIEDVVNYPNVRTLFTGLVYSEEPLEDLTSINQPWGLPAPDRTRAFSALCWLFGRNLNIKTGRPIGLIQSAWGGTRVEAWSSPDALDVCFPEGPSPGTGQNGASVLWNAMIHPFLPMPIYGAIWYQGESNQGNAASYGCALSEMVNDWRSKWFERSNGQVDESFPFGQVQLAPNNDNNAETGFPDVRWHQTYEYGYTPNPLMSNIFTAVAMDLPDFDSPHGSIHPRYKRQIADRLYLGALQVGYGDSSEGRFQGPYPASVTRNGDELEVLYDEGTLDVRTDANFEICCAVDGNTFCGTGQWTATTIVRSTDNAVTLDVTCSAGDEVTGVRYAWRESPCPLELCAVYSTENSLPAPPFVMNEHFTRNN